MPLKTLGPIGPRDVGERVKKSVGGGKKGKKRRRSYRMREEMKVLETRDKDYRR
jgi:hypothetical protein